VEAKEAVTLLDRLPDDCNMEDVQYHLYVLQAVERGQADAVAGQTISHEEVDNAMQRKWLCFRRYTMGASRAPRRLLRPRHPRSLEVPR